MKVLWKNRKYMQIQVCGLVPVFYWVERISGYLVIASQCWALYKQQHRGMRHQLCQRLLLVIGDIRLVFILGKHKFCSEKEYVELQRQFSVCLPYPVFSVVFPPLPQVIIQSASVFSSQQDQLVLFSLASLGAFGRAIKSTGETFCLGLVPMLNLCII